MTSSNSRSQRMQTLVSLAHNEANDLAARMERQLVIVREGESRLEELILYLASYRAERNEDSATLGVSAMRLAETQLFLERLQEAVAAQGRTVEEARSRYELLRAQWIAKHLRTTALGNAANRFELEEAQEVSRQDQRMQDETTARYHPGSKKGSG